MDPEDSSNAVWSAQAEIGEALHHGRHEQSVKTATDSLAGNPVYVWGSRPRSWPTVVEELGTIVDGGWYWVWNPKSRLGRVFKSSIYVRVLKIHDVFGSALERERVFGDVGQVSWRAVKVVSCSNKRSG